MTAITPEDRQAAIAAAERDIEARLQQLEVELMAEVGVANLLFQETHFGEDATLALRFCIEMRRRPPDRYWARTGQ